jgi:hypothetical protein
MHLKGVLVILWYFSCCISFLIIYFSKTIKGPDDTPYAGGIFEVDIVIPSDYPFNPPKMKFITKGRNPWFHISLIIARKN